MTQDTAAGSATLLAGMRSVVRMAAAGALWLAVGLTVTATTGCDKTNARTLDNDSSAMASAARHELDLAKHPSILFEVFGDRTNPQMVPVGVLEKGKLHAIHLSPAGWRSFDRIYNHPGATYTLYQDGRAAGTATVQQGMWSNPNAPLYTLPNCQSLIPLAAVSIASKAQVGITVEFLATSAALTQPPAAAPLTPSAVASLSREIGFRVAQSAHIPRSRLDSLDFHAEALTTGATQNPTLVVSYVDPNGEEAVSHGEETSYLFALADKSGGAYTPSYTRVINGSGAHGEYRRFVDHLDLDGDGVDEIILEGWQNGGDTYLAVMRYSSGRWIEVFRGGTNWCLDARHASPFGR